VLAVAAASADEEKKLLSEAAGVKTLELRIADSVVGELRYRPRGKAGPDGAMLRMVSTLMGLELERSRAPEWAGDEAADEFVSSVLGRALTDRGDLIARGSELGADLENGAGVLIARAVPRAPQSGDWRSRALTLALRAARAVSPGSLAAQSHDEELEGAEV